MTLQELAIIVLREQSEAQDDPTHIAVIVEQIIDSLEEIATEADWRWLNQIGSFTTNIGQSTYNLPEGIREVKFMRIPATDRELDYLAPERMSRYGLDFEQSGTPTHWFYVQPAVDAPNQTLVFGFKLYPVPNAAYTIEYYMLKNFRSYTASSQIPVQEEFLLLLKDRLRSYILTDDKDYDGADRAYQRFQTRLEKLRRREGTKNSNYLKLRTRDIASSAPRYARLDPNRFS